MTTANVTIRRGDAGDIAAIVDLNTAMAVEMGSKVVSSTRLRDGVTAVLDSGDRGFYVLADSGVTVAGVLHVIPEWNPWRNGYFWKIENVFVSREWRRKGVYRAIHDYVVNSARGEADVCGIRLFAVETNVGARRAYEDAGMTQEPCRLFEIDFVFGD
jgi:GNAT superfamily N-acetyltransferase